MKRIVIVALLFVCAPVAHKATAHYHHRAGGASSAVAPRQSTKARLNAAYGQLPLSFEANRGQTDAQVKFLARGDGYSLFLTETEAVLSLRGQNHNRKRTAPATLRMSLVGANAAPQINGLDEVPGKSNYFVGNDPQRWRTDVPRYARVRYSSVYPGIDLVYYGNQRQLEYDFIVAPGADPRRIELAFAGVERMRIDAEGNLVLRAAGGEVTQHAPALYQEVDGARRAVAGRYEIKGKRAVGFAIGDYDRTKPLVIDPTLVYSTYLGGGAVDAIADIAVDSKGNAYVLGLTNSVNFPVANAARATLSAGTCDYRAFGLTASEPCGDAFVTKINAAGTALIYSTYLGGSGATDWGYDLALDAAGDIYIVGITNSPDFPTRNALQSRLGGGSDAFVTKLRADGAALVYSTYFGGALGDVGLGIAVDAAGQAYVTGFAVSTDLPLANAFQPGYGGNGSVVSGDAFVAKLNAAGTALVYSSYLGGNDAEGGGAIALDASGAVYLGGLTLSTNFPTRNPMQAANAGQNSLSADAFIAKLSPDDRSVMATGVSAASFVGGALANQSIVALFGSGLANATVAATTAPLPTTLAGTSVKVRDSFGNEQAAPLFFVSPGQINFLIPSGLANDAVTINVASNNAVIATGVAQLVAVAPGVFTFSGTGQGVPAGYALRLRANGQQIIEPIARFDAAQNRWVAVPIDLGAADDQVFLVLYGTGVRLRSALSAVTASIGGANAEALFAGASPDLIGADQINLRLPRSLIGRGDVDVALTVDGRMANTTRVNMG